MRVNIFPVIEMVKLKGETNLSLKELKRENVSGHLSIKGVIDDA